MTERNHVILNQKEIYMGRYIFFFFFIQQMAKNPVWKLGISSSMINIQVQRQKNKKTKKPQNVTHFKFISVNPYANSN